MSVRPTDPVPNWADSGTRTTPSTPERDSGFAVLDIPPFDWVNWFWGVIADWVSHLATSASKFASLHDAVTALAIGDTGIIDEHDGASFPGASLITVALANTATGIDVSGRSVSYIDGAPGTLKLVERSDLTTDVNAAAFTVTAGVLRRTLTDGKYVAVITGNRVELFDHDAGGAALWSYDHGAAVNDIAMDGTNVYLVGAAGTGTHHARAIVIATGLSAWDYDHGGVLQAVATDGRRVFIAGAASAFGSGATMRALNASNGFDAANEGGTGLDTAGIAWDLVDANGPSTFAQLAVDGRGLLVVGMSAGTNRIQLRAVANAASLGFLDLTGANVPRVAVDQRFVYAIDLVAYVNARVIAWEKRTGARAWISGDDQDFNQVASDGAALFASLASTATFELAKLARGNRARVWRRVDVADDYLPARQLIVPAD